MPETAVLAGASLLGSRSQSRAAGRATDAQVAAQREAIAAQQQAAEQARRDVIPLFGQAQQNALMGFGSGLGVLGQTIPQQMQAFQGGNVAAQNTLLAGLPQGINAILGGSVDLSGLQTYSPQLNTSFAQQQLPDFGMLQNLPNLYQPVGPQQNPRRQSLRDILLGGRNREMTNRLTQV